MKTWILLGLGVGIVLGFGLYASRPKVPGSLSEPNAETAGGQTAQEQPSIEAAVPRPEGVPLAPPLQAAARQSTSKPIGRAPAAPLNPALDSSLVNHTADLLVSPQATYQQKQEAWKQLRDAGKLDQLIAELERRVANDTLNAACPAALGQAYLQKCGMLKDVREQGILAMQADKAFDSALNLDPANWEARFTKAVAMSYWPPMLNKGEEVIQHFETLIQQQEGQTAQPQFAQTYIWLGDQYQKAGRSDEAKAVWERGSALFPENEKLRNKLASAP